MYLCPWSVRIRQHATAIVERMPSSLAQMGRGAAPQANKSVSRARSGPLPIWALVLAAAILRLVTLGRRSFWLDEIASVAIARRPEAFFWHFLWHDEGNMALYYVLLRPWLRLGYGEATVR